MKKQTALIAIALVASFGALGLSIFDSVTMRQRILALESGATQVIPEQNRAAADAAARQLSQSINSLHDSIKKANPAQRTKIVPAQQAIDDASRKKS